MSREKDKQHLSHPITAEYCSDHLSDWREARCLFKSTSLIKGVKEPSFISYIGTSYECFFIFSCLLLQWRSRYWVHWNKKFHIKKTLLTSSPKISYRNVRVSSIFSVQGGLLKISIRNWLLHQLPGLHVPCFSNVMHALCYIKMLVPVNKA